MNKSPEINELAAALVKAQNNYNALIKDSSNPFFKSKYADLAACIECVREPLAKQGLSVVQSTDVISDTVTVVETMIIHTSGQWISGRYPLTPTKPDCQGLGAALTYARRYSLTAMLGIAAEDDDGNAASGKTQPAAAPKYAKAPENPVYDNPAKWSKAVTDKAAKVEKDGLKGSAALMKYIPTFNAKNKTEYAQVSDFNTDKLLGDLIKFVEDAVPEKLL